MAMRRWPGGAVELVLMMCAATTHCAMEANPFGTGMFFPSFDSSQCSGLTRVLFYVDA
jgi:hypothetical protein